MYIKKPCRRGNLIASWGNHRLNQKDGQWV